MQNRKKIDRNEENRMQWSHNVYYKIQKRIPFGYLNNLRTNE